VRFTDGSKILLIGKFFKQLPKEAEVGYCGNGPPEFAVCLPRLQTISAV